MTMHRALLTAAMLLGVLAAPALAQTGTPPPNQQVVRATATPQTSATATPTAVPEVEDVQATVTATATTEPVRIAEPTMPAWVPDCSPDQPQGTDCWGKG